MLIGEPRRHQRRHRLEDVPVGGAGFGLEQLLAQEESQRPMADPGRLLDLERPLLLAAPGDQDIPLPEGEPAARTDIPAAVQLTAERERDRRRRQLVRRPEIRLDPPDLAAEVVADNRPRVAAVEDQGDGRGLGRQLPQPELDLVVLDVPVLMRSPAAVRGDDRLVEAIGLVPFEIGHLRAVAAVVEDHDIVLTHPLDQLPHRPENALPRRPLIRDHGDMALRKFKRIHENLPHHLDIIDTAGELTSGSEVGIPVDADQQGPSISAEY
jgi:hypothetical protein